MCHEFDYGKNGRVGWTFTFLEIAPFVEIREVQQNIVINDGIG